MSTRTELTGQHNDKKYLALCVALVLLVTVPILIYAAYSVPAADDFSNAVRIGEMREKYSNPIIAALYGSYRMYFDVSGYFFAVFLNYVFSPFYYFGLTGLRIFNVCAHLFFMSVMFVFINVLVKEVLKGDRLLTWIIYSMSLFLLYNSYSNIEIYTWYCVLVGYVLPISIMFLSLSFNILSLTRKKKSYLILAMISAFLVSGSSLNVTALNCGILFIISFIDFMVNDRKNIRSVLVFVAGMIGAFIAVVAPGNYTRHESVSEDYNIMKALKDASDATVFFFTSKMFHTLFPVLLIVIAVALFVKVDYTRFKNGHYFRHPLLVLIISYLGVLIVNFPVALGYDTTNIPSRCVFVQDIATYLLSLLCVFVLVGWVKLTFPKLVLNREKLFGVSMALIMFCLIICGMYGKDFTTNYMIRSISSGRLQKCSEYQWGIIDEIAHSDEKSVVLSRDKEITDTYFMSIGLTSDKDYWVNSRLRQFYNKDSVIVEYKD